MIRNNILIMLLACFFVNCKSSDRTEKTVVNEVKLLKTRHHELFMEELSDEHRLVIQSVVNEAKCLLLNKKDLSEKIYCFFKDFASLSDKKITSLPYYMIDIDQFYKNPNPENIIKTLYRPEDKMAFVVSNEERILYVITTIKHEGKWHPSSQMVEIEEAYGWLLKKLKNDDATNLNVFRFEGLYYITYLTNGKRKYFTGTGIEYSPDELCEKFVDLINVSKEAVGKGDVLYI